MKIDIASNFLRDDSRLTSLGEDEFKVKKAAFDNLLREDAIKLGKVEHKN